MYDTTRYVRQAGAKLLMLGASFGAVAAALPGHGDASIAEASWAGIKLVHLILGTMGAGASLFFLPQFTGMALGRVVTCGILCAGVGTPFLSGLGTALMAKYLGITGTIAGGENVLAAALGVGGVHIIPFLQWAFTSFRENPWGFIDRLRGRQAPPGPPGGQP
jgi:hypothetical protein